MRLSKPLVLCSIILLGVSVYAWSHRPVNVVNAPPRPGPIVAFGDSLTAGFGGSAGRSYPDQLSDMIGRPVLEGCFSTCQPRKIPCHRTEDCQLRPIWEHLETKISSVLDSVTLADLVHSEEDVRICLDRIEGEEKTGAARRESKARCSKKRKRPQAGGRS